MNILLAGGAGYIGSHTAVSLFEAGHYAIIYDNFKSSSPTVERCIEKITKKKVPFTSGDILDTALLTGVLQKHAGDAVIHFAGLKAVGGAVKAPVSYYANNVQGITSLVQAMQVANVKNLIFSSSAGVYRTPQYLPLDEAHPTVAVNPYGLSKLHIEEMLQDVANSDAAWRIACLRYFNPVGAHASALIGGSPRGVPNNLIPNIVQVAFCKLPSVSVYGSDYRTPDGTGVRDYIHVVDLAQGHVAALDYLKTQSGWSVFNLGTGRGYSVREVLHAFELACGFPIRSSTVGRRPGDVASAYANMEKARQLMGWSASREIHDICANAWQFARMQAVSIGPA
jgi:UDP-glucose 4-epimerase